MHEKNVVNGERLIALGCADVEEFLDTYYLHDRYKGRGDEYVAGLLASAKEHFARHGYVIISRHDSTLRRAVWYYGTAEDAARALRADAAHCVDRAEHFEAMADGWMQARAKQERTRANSLSRQAVEMERLAALGRG